ncbi:MULTISPECIES: hypothetical protein [Salinivibrio]|nr:MULTISPECIES: hypothetical protein [Salinivibrio]OOE48053.1 hypothetical protein BZG11_15235 [Salinivibrio kushneri]OOE60773.1 hypothetical protein BZG14_13185 [Salinivibrio sp. IB282]
MTQLKTLFFAVTTAALAGCAATPRKYDDESSRALNLARAGGVYDQDLRDSPDGTRSYRKGLFTTLLDVASLATSFDAPLRHLSGTQTFMFNATDIMATPDNPSARPSLIGWMPGSLAANQDDAYEHYVTVVDEAITHAAESMSITATKLTDVKTPEIDEHPLMLWSVTSERYGCGKSNCIIAYNIQQPTYWKTPSYVTGREAASYNIAANHPEEYSRLIFRQSGDERTFPVGEFYSAVSADMPPWIVMYFPPNTVFQDGEPLTYPVLYEQGQQLMFKEPNHE